MFLKKTLVAALLTTFVAGTFTLTSCEKKPVKDNLKKDSLAKIDAKDKKDSLSDKTDEKNEDETTQDTPNGSYEGTSSRKTLKTLKADPKFDEVATYLAGLPSKEKNSDLEVSAAWKSYASASNSKWNNLKNGKFAKMRPWAKEYLAEPRKLEGLVFYPFSGADFIHADAFFPDADEYLLIGLEPIGTYPTTEKINKNAAAYFNGLNQAMYFLVEYSFFRTLSMADDLTGRRVAAIDGTLPLLLTFMKNLGHDILYYDRVAIDNSGKMVSESNYKKPAGKDETIYGTRLYFKDTKDKNNANAKTKILHYFGTDISDSGLKKNPHMATFLQSLRPNTTYLKSASYLMHNDYFSTIRNAILDNTKFLVQDDSGMPIRFLPENKWDNTYFGAYTGPIPLFSGRYQKDLRTAYTKDVKSIKPLPFGIGYMFREGTSNIMMAKRIKGTEKNKEAKVKAVVEVEEKKETKKDKKPTK